jgi:Mrp family chromosome partitioning ATPase
MKAISQFTNDVAWGKLDYIIVDLPPGTGDEPLSVAQLLKSDGVIVVTTPQDVALLDSRKAINFSKELNVPVIGIIENMSGFICPHCGKEIDLFKKGGGEKASKDMNVPFLGSIPIDTKIVESSDSGAPFILDNGNSKAKKAFENIVSKVEEFFEKNKKEVI